MSLAPRSDRARPICHDLGSDTTASQLSALALVTGAIVESLDGATDSTVSRYLPEQGAWGSSSLVSSAHQDVARLNAGEPASNANKKLNSSRSSMGAAASVGSLANVSLLKGGLLQPMHRRDPYLTYSCRSATVAWVSLILLRFELPGCHRRRAKLLTSDHSPNKIAFF